jgi:hypothetical protein
MSSFTTYGIILDKQKTNHIYDIAGLIGVKQDFFSIISRDTIANDKYRGFTIHFPTQKELVKNIHEKIMNKINIPLSAIIDYTIKQHVVPTYSKQHQLFLDQVHNILSHDRSLYLSGNYFSRLAIDSCIERSNFEYNRFNKNHKKN